MARRKKEPPQPPDMVVALTDETIEKLARAIAENIVMPDSVDALDIQRAVADGIVDAYDRIYGGVTTGP